MDSPPGLGGDTADVLANLLGLIAAEIAALHADHVICAA
jgi:crotonobetainyl-CoA:carnitine CoA-transferase CaiB-like acyl-CoA transferase